MDRPYSRKQDLHLQRLFSTFAKGWPGMGLLCLRLGAGLALFDDGIARWAELPHKQVLVTSLIEAGGGICLFAGFWTPIAGTVIAMAELWIAFSQSEHLRSYILLAVIGAALAMLGPGAWSIDARLFGRKRIRIPDQ